MTHEELLQQMYDSTLVGNKPEVVELTNKGLEAGIEPTTMLFESLIPALEEVGARFERGDFFVPEMLIAGRAMTGALEILRLTEDTYRTARAHQLLAYIELDRGNAQEALDLLEEGWPLLEESANGLERAQYRLEEARALARLGRSEEAAALAMQISGLIADAHPEDAARSYAVLAGVFDDLGDRSRARELYELAAELLEPQNPNRFLIDVYSRLADIAESEGRKEEAYELMKKAVGMQKAVADAAPS